MRVVEACAGSSPEPATAYIAPGGRHLRIRRRYGGGELFEVTEDPPENNCRPAVDYLFRSLADTYGGRVLPVIMTGMGRDGVAGLRVLKQRGARVLGQDASTSAVDGMPRAARDAGLVDEVLPLHRLAGRIAMLCAS